MKIVKLQLLFISFLLMGVSGIFAQSFRYVAFFPTNNLAHYNVLSKKVYLAGRNNAQANISGTLTLAKLTAEKDLELDLSHLSNTSLISPNVGYGNYILDESGRFVVNKKNNDNSQTITISTISHINQINAVEELIGVSKISWGSNQAFPISGSTSVGSDLCWCPLRIQGTYEYRNYLVACNGSCP